VALSLDRTHSLTCPKVPVPIRRSERHSRLARVVESEDDDDVFGTTDNVFASGLAVGDVQIELEEEEDAQVR